MIAVALVPAVSQARPKYVTYERFGAVGDGFHDDQHAIVRAHEAANKWNVPVRAGKGKTYYIGPGAEVAVIRTDVDFGDARFIIDDVECEDRGAPVFRVESSYSPQHVRGVRSLSAGQQNLGVSLRRRSLVQVMDSTRKVFIRKGNNQNGGTSAQEVFIAGKDGAIEEGTGLIWDYGRITSIVAYPVDEKVLTIRGGVFVTIANQINEGYKYFSRNLHIRRSNVCVEGLTHLVEGEREDYGAPYSGFITLAYAADVTVRDCVFTGRRTYSTMGKLGKPVKMGSYDITARSCIRLALERCTQTNNIDDKTWWGTFSSNFCKGISLTDCVLSRFDAHMGVRDVTLRRCIFGHQGVQAVGFGTMSVEDCEVHRNTLVLLRQDYGSFWYGDVVIRNCTLRPVANPASVCIIDGRNNGDHDFGYVCGTPRRVRIDGLLIDDAAVSSSKYHGPAVFSDFGRDASAVGLEPFEAHGVITARGVRVTGGSPLRLSDNPALFRDYSFSVE